MYFFVFMNDVLLFDWQNKQTMKTPEQCMKSAQSQQLRH